MISASKDPFQARADGHFGRLYSWENHEVIELNSAELMLKISLTRGAEVLELRDKRKNLDILWHNHQDIVRNRPYVSSLNTQFGNFLEHFSGGWQEVMPAAQYAVEYGGIAVGGHGEVALLSWNYEILKDDHAELVVKFWVDLRLFPLRLVRIMTLKNETLRLDESVTNLGSTLIEFQWGHHLALGGPFTDPGAELIVAEGEPFEVPNYPSPSYRFEVEQQGSWPTVTQRNGELADLKLLPENDGTDGHVILGPMRTAKVGLRNAVVGLRADMSWGSDVFPYCWIWMVWGGIKQYPLWGSHRLITIEPFSSPTISLTDAIEKKLALELSAGAQLTAWVEFSIREL